MDFLRRTTFDVLDRQGWKGQDGSLAVALGEYGLAWRDGKDGETEFIFGVDWDERAGVWFGFGMGELRESDFASDFDWVKWPELLSFVGMTAEEWGELPFGCRVSDLVSYYGWREVFGDSWVPKVGVAPTRHELRKLEAANA